MLLGLAKYHGATTDPYFADVVSLLHCDGSDHSTAFSDVTGKIWTRNGTVTEISTTRSLYGGSSLFIGATGGAGTNNGITTPHSSEFDFGSADWTIEWAHNNTHDANFLNIFSYGGTGSGAILMETDGLGNNIIVYIAGSSIFTESGSPAVNTWHQYALVKDSSVIRLYRDGVQVGSASNSTSIGGSYTPTWGAYANGTFAFSGYQDEMRITKNVCRYPGGITYTPATGQFPDS